MLESISCADSHVIIYGARFYESVSLFYLKIKLIYFSFFIKCCGFTELRINFIKSKRTTFNSS